MTVKLPRLNLEIESGHQFQNNASFVMSKEKSLYSSQSFAVKTITIMSDIANSVLLTSDNGPSGGPINHVNNSQGLYERNYFARPCFGRVRTKT